MTINQARLNNSTDDELLNLLDEKRYLSPIINELCKRLEVSMQMEEPQHLNKAKSSF